MSISKEIVENCKERFSTHKATLIQDTERYFAVDWRSESGSGDYYVNYILDKKRGSLIISGDLGDCINADFETANEAAEAWNRRADNV